MIAMQQAADVKNRIKQEQVSESDDDAPLRTLKSRSLRPLASRSIEPQEIAEPKAAVEGGREDGLCKLCQEGRLCTMESI